MGNSRSLDFAVNTEEDGSYSARCIGYDIFTEGDTFEELLTNIREVIEAYFFDQPGEYTFQLHVIEADPVSVSA